MSEKFLSAFSPVYMAAEKLKKKKTDPKAKKREDNWNKFSKAQAMKKGGKVKRQKCGMGGYYRGKR